MPPHSGWDRGGPLRVHGGSIAKVDGTAWVHSTGGNMAILAGSTIVRTAGAPQWYRGASLGIVVLGLLSSAMLVIDSRTAATNVMPDGAWE